MRRLERVDDWIQRGTAAHFSARELAGLCTVSAGQLRRFFACKVGTTPHDWLHELRLWNAARLVCQEKSLKEIAFELKFADVAHLCHSFKEYHGCTPAQFAALHQARQRKFRAFLSRNKLSPVTFDDFFVEPWSSAEHALSIQVIFYRFRRK